MITEQDLTIYHNLDGKWVQYQKKGTIRNTENLVRSSNGTTITDTVTVRLFDTNGFEKDYYCSKGDVIVPFATNYEVEKTPITELRKLYGKENVYEVTSITKNIFEDAPLNLRHIKIGAK